MSTENLLWGAPRIHGELLKLGFEVAQSSGRQVLVKRRGRQARMDEPSLRNHAPEVAAMDCSLSRQLASECSTAS